MPRALGRVVRVGWLCHSLAAPCRGMPLRAPALPPKPCLSLYKTLYRGPTPKWAVAHSSFISYKLFFFSLIFFSFVILTARSQIYIYIFTSSSRTKNIYLYFFPVLHAVKPQKKIKKSQHFFFSFDSFSSLHNTGYF